MLIQYAENLWIRNITMKTMTFAKRKFIALSYIVLLIKCNCFSIINCCSLNKSIGISQYKINIIIHYHTLMNYLFPFLHDLKYFTVLYFSNHVIVSIVNLIKVVTFRYFTTIAGINRYQAKFLSLITSEFKQKIKNMILIITFNQ